MNFKGKRGFTLIELLVVIAIIGILSSVVLASLNTARDKGREAAIKSNMQTIRVQAELYYNNNNFEYGVAAICTTAATVMADPTVQAAIVEVDTINGPSNVFCGSTAQAWAVSTVLPDGTNWCTDSTGIAKAAITANGVDVCP